MLEDEHFLDASVYISPPGDGMLSDEDSDVEEGSSVNHLSANQLTAPAEFVINYGNENINSLQDIEVQVEVGDIAIENAEEESNVGAPSTDPVTVNLNCLASSLPPNVNHNWKKEDLKNRIFQNIPSVRQFKEPLSPQAIFNVFFDDEVVEHMVRMTNLYAQRDKGKHTFSTDQCEMRLFLAMLLLTGYTELPRRKMYWENADDVFNKSMSDAMSRNRFEELLSVFHLADNENLDPSDGMAKVRPLYSQINERCLQYFLNEDCLSVDESMLPYYGRHSSKQRIIGKPVRMGYKMWVLATSDGYVVQFEPYLGAKKTGGTRSSSVSWGLGEQVVLDLLEELPRETSYHIFMDNFFTSFRLLDHLFNNGIRATGVIRSNKLSKCPIESSKSLEKKPRGFFDQRTDNSNSLTIVGWNDNRSVYVVSNAIGSQPTVKVSRWCRKTNTRIDVDQPNLIKMYNRHMGGVDRCDQNISAYRISTRTKKWWWALFAWIPDMVLQNSWLLYR